MQNINKETIDVLSKCIVDSIQTYTNNNKDKIKDIQFSATPPPNQKEGDIWFELKPNNDGASQINFNDILGGNVIPIVNGGTGASTAEEATKGLSYNKVLWTGELNMTASQTVILSEAVSAQPTGVVCVWSRYSNGALNQSFVFHFVPKVFVAWHNGVGHAQMMCRYQTTTTYAIKYIYIHDDNIVGHNSNTDGNSANYVLRYVIGV